LPFRITLVPFLLFATVFVALLGIVNYTFHPLATRAVVSQPVASGQAAGERPALSAGEEIYAAELGQIHSAVKLAAVEMSFAGVAYKTEHHDPRRLVQKIRLLTDQFTMATDQVRSLQVPASMQETNRRYLEALDLYGKASAEMIKVSQDASEDASNGHLIEAQDMTHRAAEELLRVGDRLWPGEYKPH
jgi:hypothetical protein